MLPDVWPSFAPCTGSLSYSRSHSTTSTLGTLLLLIGGETSLLFWKNPSPWSPCPLRHFSPTIRVPMALSPFLSVWLGLLTEGLFSSQKLWGCLLVVQVCRHPPSSTGMCLHHQLPVMVRNRVLSSCFSHQPHSPLAHPLSSHFWLVESLLVFTSFAAKIKISITDAIIFKEYQWSIILFGY